MCPKVSCLVRFPWRQQAGSASDRDPWPFHSLPARQQSPLPRAIRCPAKAEWGRSGLDQVVILAPD